MSALPLITLGRITGPGGQLFELAGQVTDPQSVAAMSSNGDAINVAVAGDEHVSAHVGNGNGKIDAKINGNGHVKGDVK